MLSSGKGAAGDALEEEGKHGNRLVLLWPCGSCIVTFRSVVGPRPTVPPPRAGASVAVPTGQGCAGPHLCPQAGEQRALRLFLLSLCSSRALKELWVSALRG